MARKPATDILEGGEAEGRKLSKTLGPLSFAMAHDGLLPGLFAHTHPRLQTPCLSQMLIGGVAAVVAALVPIHILGEMASIGTLFAFVLVCGALVYLRRSDAEVFRPFRVPGVPWVPLFGILSCLLLMVGLPLVTWMRLAVWLAAGLAIYFSCGRSHSALRHPPAGRPEARLKRPASRGRRAPSA